VIPFAFGKSSNRWAQCCYCCALDNGEVEAVVDCFTIGAIFKSPVIDISGRDEICAFAGRFAAQRAAGAVIWSATSP
jgi:hypothetical protein